MSDLAISETIPLPKSWPQYIKAGVIHAISLAHYGLTFSRSWAANSPLARVRLSGQLDASDNENALLCEEIRIKDARMQKIHPQKRPHTAASPFSNASCVLSSRNVPAKSESPKIPMTCAASSLRESRCLSPCPQGQHLLRSKRSKVMRPTSASIQLRRLSCLQEALRRPSLPSLYDIAHSSTPASRPSESLCFPPDGVSDRGLTQQDEAD